MFYSVVVELFIVSVLYRVVSNGMSVVKLKRSYGIILSQITCWLEFLCSVCCLHGHPMLQVSTEDGMIHSIDRTQPDSKLFTLNAHDSSLSGMFRIFDAF